MSRSKIFEARNIALESNNQAMLKSWSNCITKAASKHNIFQYSEKKIDVQDGTINHFISWTCDVLKCSYLDQGKLFTLDLLKVELDYGALEFINDFELTLVKLASQKLGLTSEIDRDLIEKDALLIHPFGLIKEILLRTLSYALSKEGAKNEFSDEYLAIFSDFIRELSTLKIAFNSHFIKLITAERYTTMITELGAIVPRWGEMALNIIQSVKEINRVNYTIEENQRILEQAQLQIQRHLYCRLTSINNQKIDDDKLERVWVVDALEVCESQILLDNSCGFIQLLKNPSQSKFEDIKHSIQNKNAIILFNKQLYFADVNKQEIIELDVSDLKVANIDKFKSKFTSSYQLADKNQLQLIRTIRNANNQNRKIVQKSKGISVSTLRDKIQRAEDICTILATMEIVEAERETHEEKMEWIKKLYFALHEIDGMLAILGDISSLSIDLGCLLFLFNVINSMELSNSIEKSLKLVSDACDDIEFIKTTSLGALALKNTWSRTRFYIHSYDFDRLDDAFRNNAQKRIYSRLFNLRSLAIATGNPQLINLKTIFKLDSYAFPALTDTQCNDTLQHHTIQVIDQGVSDIPIDSNPYSNDSIFNALGADRTELLTILFEKIKIDFQIQSIVGAEAIERFANKLFPEAICLKLVDAEILTNVAFLTIQKKLKILCDLLREEFKIKLLHPECLHMNDIDLINHIVEINPQLLKQKKFASNFNEYKQDKAVRQNNLKTICNQ